MKMKKKRKRIRLEAKLRIGGNLDGVKIKKDNAFIDAHVPHNLPRECKSNNFQNIIGYLMADAEAYGRHRNTKFSYEINIKIIPKT